MATHSNMNWLFDTLESLMHPEFGKYRGDSDSFYFLYLDSSYDDYAVWSCLHSIFHRHGRHHTVCKGLFYLSADRFEWSEYRGPSEEDRRALAAAATLAGISDLDRDRMLDWCRP